MLKRNPFLVFDGRQARFTNPIPKHVRKLVLEKTGLDIRGLRGVVKLLTLYGTTAKKRGTTEVEIDGYTIRAKRKPFYLEIEIESPTGKIYRVARIRRNTWYSYKYLVTSGRL